MPKPELFQRLGLYTFEHLLDADICRRLREAFQSGRTRAGTVGVADSAEFVVDASVRSVRVVDVGETLSSEVRSRLLATKPAIEAFYKLPLTDCEPLQFLAYSVGDHYTAHRDGRADHTASESAKARRISAVIFLNDQSAEAAPEHYGGGALTFFELFDHPSGNPMGIPLDASEGLLMTFPSHLLHSVTPVTHGERYTIATWFF